MSKNISDKSKIYKYIFFDLDGTLTDSAEGIMNCVKVALSEIGIKGNYDNLESFIGPPLRESFGRYTSDKKLLDKALEVFRKRYKEIGWRECSIYDGVFDLIVDLKKAGKTIVLASAKPEPFCKLVLEYFGLIPYFDFIGGAKFDGTLDDKGDIIAYCLSNVGNPDKNEVVMIGDRKFDIIGARKNSIDAIGVTYGYAPSNELFEAKADYIVDNIPKLHKLLI